VFSIRFRPIDGGKSHTSECPILICHTLINSLTKYLGGFKKKILNFKGPNWDQKFHEIIALHLYLFWEHLSLNRKNDS